MARTGEKQFGYSPVYTEVVLSCDLKKNLVDVGTDVRITIWSQENSAMPYRDHVMR
jgi:hypothetical protein